MDQGARRVETGKRRAVSPDVALSGGLGRSAQPVQEFRRARTVHRAVAETPRIGETAGPGRFPHRIVNVDSLTNCSRCRGQRFFTEKIIRKSGVDGGTASVPSMFSVAAAVPAAKL